MLFVSCADTRSYWSPARHNCARLKGQRYKTVCLLAAASVLIDLNENMQSYSCKSPVAFLIFNGPIETRQVFAEIAKARPPKLLVVADGPRKHLPNEVGYCQEARRIASQIDWNCELMTNFSTENLGCAERVSTGIDWVFN